MDVREADADNPVMTLSDGVVTLRPWSRDDAGFMAEAFADPAIRRYNGLPDRLDARLRRSRSRTLRPSSTNSRRTGVRLLRLGHHLVLRSQSWTRGLANWSAAVASTTGPKTDVAQFGYWIAAGARGRGYATRAVILLTRWLFELGAARVFLTIVAENEEVSRGGPPSGVCA